MTKMNIEAKIYALLQTEFAPEQLKVENESHRHAGHAGAGGEGDADFGNTHFKVRISGTSLNSANRIAQHKAIYACLNSLMNNPIHALAIEVV